MVHGPSLELAVQHYETHERDYINHRRQFCADAYAARGNEIDIDLCFDLWVTEQPIHARYFRISLDGQQRDVVVMHLRAVAAALAAANSFEAIFAVVNGLDVRGFREMGVYDISWYIGAQRGIAPNAVYLHCGTRVGARALGLPGNPNVVEVATLANLPNCQPLERLSAQEVENLLCDYSTAFGNDLPFEVKCFRCRNAHA